MPSILLPVLHGRVMDVLLIAEVWIAENHHQLFNMPREKNFTVSVPCTPLPCVTSNNVEHRSSFQVRE